MTAPTHLDGLGYRGTNVVVTGCASGMGQSTARILGELGAAVHAVDVREPSVDHASFHQTDLADPAQVEATIAQLGKRGPFQHVFACAGISHTFGPMACMRVNYIGTRQLVEGLLPSVADGGSIAVISSDAGMGFLQQLPALLELLAIDDPVQATAWCESHPDVVRDGYSTSKEMLHTWIMHRAASLGEQRRIRLNGIAPCPTLTPFTADAARDLGDAFFDEFPYPLLGRIATPDEQAWPLVLLNSPLNGVVTGAVLYTDQGFAGGLFTGSLDAGKFMGEP